MKLIPSTVLRGLCKTLPVVLSLLAIPVFSQSQRETNFGLIMSASMDKSLNRFFDLTLGEEIRLIDNTTGFDRSATTAGLDYALWNRKIKLGAYYEFIYLYNNDHLYEPRHRYYFNLSYKETIDQFTLSWRGRIQGTVRDENRGSYKINPKYVLKNRFQVEYSVWGKPWKPFVSCELSNELNNPMGNELTRYRYQGGVTWRLNRTDYLEFFARYDWYADRREAQVFSLGVGYKVKL